MSAAYDTYCINIHKAQNFIVLYNSATENRGPGRRDTLTTDILRAGVVFLHSTLEDYLRSVILSKKIAMLNTTEADFKSVLTNVNLVGDNTGKSSVKKYTLGEFWDVKDKPVITIVEEALRDKVSYMTFNDYSQIVASLATVGINLSTNFNPDGIIDNYIKRRHKIVHEADNNSAHGPGNYKATSINANTLTAWINAVNALVSDIENQL